MKPDFLTTAHPALHGDAVGMLRSAWRRAGTSARFPAHGATAIGVILAVAGAVAVAIAASAAPPPVSRTQADPILPTRADAVQALLAARYATAYGRFAALADNGDASSALLALALVSEGPSIFGSEWSATPGQLRRWSALAIQGVHEHTPQITGQVSGD